MIFSVLFSPKWAVCDHRSRVCVCECVFPCSLTHQCIIATKCIQYTLKMYDFITDIINWCARKLGGKYAINILYQKVKRKQNKKINKENSNNNATAQIYAHTAWCTRMYHRLACPTGCDFEQFCCAALNKSYSIK